MLSTQNQTTSTAPHASIHSLDSLSRKTSDDLDALWCYGDDQMCAAAKALSVGNLKQIWTNEGRATDLFKTEQGEGRFYLQHAYQVKNIWVPYGE